MTQADEIRCYVLTAILKPAWRRGERQVVVTASEVVKGMGLEERYTHLCRVLDAPSFTAFAGVRLVDRRGRRSSSAAEWTFAIGGELRDCGALLG